jgi:hypothetical protein
LRPEDNLAETPLFEPEVFVPKAQGKANLASVALGLVAESGMLFMRQNGFRFIEEGGALDEKGDWNQSDD